VSGNDDSSNAPGAVHCAIYARVSTKKQAEENTSIAVQLEVCRKLAAERGWKVFYEYVDPGASGRTEKGRPQFSAMLQRALTPDPPFTEIIVYEHSRFYRNVGESEVARVRLAVNGVHVHSVMQPIEDDGLLGSLAITIQAAVDEQHSKMTALKVRSGMRAAAEEGFFVGGTVPYGYKLEFAEKRGTKIKNRLAIDPDPADVVRRMFELYLQGLGIKALTTKLNADNVPSKTGGKWSISTVGKMLRLPTYVGRHLFKPTDWRTKKRVHRSEWVEIPCPAIVDETVFQNVQRLLTERDPRMNPPRETNSDVLLAKIARCGSCGGKLQASNGTGSNGTVYDYYKCSAKLKTGFCPGGQPTSIPRALLDDLVIGKVVDELLTRARIREIVNRAAQMQSDVRENASTRIDQLKRQLAAAKKKENNLWELAADQGIKARQGFLARLDAIQEETAGLNRQISLQQEIVSRSVRPLTEAEADQKAQKMRELILTSDPKTKRRFVRAIIDRVVVYDDRIEVVGAESTLAETASDVDIRGVPPVHSSDRGYGAGARGAPGLSPVGPRRRPGGGNSRRS
jgi:DNA invertase Pin-like site-specific DNA recombinase